MTMVTPTQEQAAADLKLSLQIGDLGDTLPKLIELVSALQQRIEQLERGGKRR